MIPALVPSGSKLNKLQRTLAAGGEHTLMADCHFVYFVEASFGVEVSFDSGPFIPMNLALGYKAPSGEVITSITIRNTLTKDTSFLIFYGRGEIIDQRLNVLESRNGSAASLVPNGVLVSSSFTVPVGDNVIIPANPNRKNVVIEIFPVGSIGDPSSIHISSSGFPIKRVVVKTGQNLVLDNLVIVDPTVLNDAGLHSTVCDYSGQLSVDNWSNVDITVTWTEIVYS